MANEELQRRSRRVRIFWIVPRRWSVIAIGLSMLPDAVEADLAKADRGDVRVEVVDEGRTRMHDIYVVSAPITGRVLRVEVEPGDVVAAGAVLGAHVASGGGVSGYAQRLAGRALWLRQRRLSCARAS
jgi:HlyD family secretion protein